MSNNHVLVTGSCGLIGSEVCLHFYQSGYSVVGVDNNQRAVFFGPEGDTSWSLHRLRKSIPGYAHHAIDIRDREAIIGLVKSERPTLIVHTAAQPSHDRAAAIPFDDFDTNAVGTLNLLEAARRALQCVGISGPGRLAVLKKDPELRLYRDLQRRGVIAEGMGFSSDLISSFELGWR